MSSFNTPLDLRANDDGLTFTLLTEFDYEIGQLGSGRIIRVPCGFITDFASVPRIFWNILPPWGRYGKAAVLHDWNYKRQEFTRAFCDDILDESMQALGVNWMTRHIIWLGVRTGGWVAWNQHKRENALAQEKAKQSIEETTDGPICNRDPKTKT